MEDNALINKKNWEETKQKWTDYWNHCNTGRPLMCVIARKPEIEQYANGEPGHSNNYRDVICQGKYYNLPEELKWKDMEDKYLDPDRMVARYRYFCETHEFLGESFPNIPIDLGPGSMALYLGSGIGYNEDTVWFTKCYEELEDAPELKFDPNNEWFVKHLAIAKRCKELAGDDFLVDMPDLMENLDVIASLHGTTETMCDIAVEPEEITQRIEEIEKAYEPVVDQFYDAIKDENGGNAYTVFQIWGPGKTAKVQSDVSVMISPETFREFVQPSLRRQTEKLDHALFHLDGAGMIRHLDAILEIDGIEALQWTSGDDKPDGTMPEWDEIYDKTIAAGKSIWVKVYTGEFEDWIRNSDRIVKKYGSHSLFFLFPEMSLEQANTLLQYAEENWKDVKGTFCEELARSK